MQSKTKQAARAAAILSLLPLAACGGGGGGETRNNVDALENAARQADPMTRNVLMNKAEAIEGQTTHLPPNAPGSPTQQALEQAGNARAGAQGAGQRPPPPVQAVPHKAGDPVPPPKTTPQP